ncbi:cwf18 pre-mRNA splicing factor-domain-containing protein [Chiua virens]|nr:cwf18 pre-mRNA splicing factor-domain-containing protein [Chiua virens]
MSLQEASEARKARLVALRSKKEGRSDGDNSQSVLLNRNFDPETRTLKKHTQNERLMQDTVEKDVEDMADTIIAEDERRRAQELDVFNIAPKRPNWDLKRETEKKLAKLERKTQEAIHTLISEYCSKYILSVITWGAGQRLSVQKGESEDVVGAMNAQERAYEEEVEEEE